MEPGQVFAPNNSTSNDAPTPSTLTPAVSSDSLATGVMPTPSTSEQPQNGTVQTASEAKVVEANQDSEPPETPTASTEVSESADTTPPQPSVSASAESAPVVASPATENSQTGTPVVASVSSTPEVSGLGAAAVISGATNTPGLGDGGAKRKKMLLFGAAGAAVLLLSGAAVFGMYLPNRPENVWKNGLGRSGKALSALVEKAADKKTIETFQNSKMSLTADLTWGETTGKLRWDGKSDSKNTNGTMTISSTGGGMDVGGKFEYITNLTETAQLPNLYFKVSELKNIPIEQYEPRLAPYVNKWIFLDSKTLQQYYPEISDGLKDSSKKVTSNDVAAAAKTLTETVRDHVLTSDTRKAVIVRKKFVGKEQINGIQAYHFTAGVDAKNAAAYCEVLVRKMTETELFKKLAAETEMSEESKKNSIKECQDSVQRSVKESDVFDVWIDAKYKLVHQVRLPEKQGDNTVYAEFGQVYKGGDDLSLFVRYHNGGDSPYDVKSTLDTNTVTGVTTANVDASSPKSGESEFQSAFSLKMTFKSEPLKQKVEQTIPTDTVPFTELLAKMGVAAPESSGNTSSQAPKGSITARAYDSERQTDINALRSQVEVHYANWGNYPSLAQINDAAWRTKNMRGLSSEALRDPESSSEKLASVASRGTYGYQALPANCSGGENATIGCDSFVLTAILSDGTKYTKDSEY